MYQTLGKKTHQTFFCVPLVFRGALILFLLALITFASCSEKTGSSINYESVQIAPVSYNAKSSAGDQAQTTFIDAPFEPLALQSKNRERKLKKSAELILRVSNFEDAAKNVNAILEGYDAYSASMAISENSIAYSIKVPSASYEALLKSLEALGKTTHKVQNQEDVTVHYYDTEGKLSTKLELLKTFRSYLGQAKNIDEIMQVESRIASLQQEIDWMGEELSAIAALVDYGQIGLNLTLPPSLRRHGGPSFGEKISEMFKQLGSFLSGILVVLLGIVIYGIPILAVIAAFYILLFGRFGLAKKLWRLVNFRK